MAEQNNKSEFKAKKIKKFNLSVSYDHTLKKRPPHKYQTNNTTIYVSTKSNVKVLLEKCSKLILDDNENELTIFCLGAAIQRGILLALQVCEKHPTFQNDVQTLTTELIDDLEPATDEADYEIQKRHNSALRIRIFRTNPLKTVEVKDPIS